jgi:hypothetical protein
MTFDLGGKPQLTDSLQNLPKSGIRSVAHGSIRIQEGQPSINIDVWLIRRSLFLCGKNGKSGTEGARTRHKIGHSGLAKIFSL